MPVNTPFINEIPVWTALVTPMTENGAIDFESLDHLIEQQNHAMNGIVLFGSTGEGLALTLDEKKAILKHVLDLKPLSPIMIGVGGHRLPEQLDWLAFCETMHVSAYLMVTPLYAKPGPVGQTEWFNALLSKVTRPCMLYNVPSRAGTELHPQVLNNLQGQPYLWAVKEASGSITKFQTYQTAAGPNVRFYSGDDVLMPDLVKVGAKGLVSVASNVWPAETKRYAEQCLSGTLDVRGKALWKQAAEACFCASNPVPSKALLALRGDIAHATCRPPLTEKELTDTTLLKTVDRTVKSWFAEGA